MTAFRPFIAIVIAAVTNIAFAILALRWVVALGGAAGGGLEAERAGFPAAEPVRVYCAAVIRQPVVAITTEFTRRTSVPVELDFGGSGDLLARIQLARHCDIFVSADSSYVDRLRQNQLVMDRQAIARIRPSLVVVGDAATQIKSRSDVWLPKWKIGIANPETAAIGRATRDLLNHLTPAVAPNPRHHRNVVMKPTVTDLVGDLTIGAVDAAIIWDVLAHQLQQRSGDRPVRIISLPSADRFAMTIEAALLKPTAVVTERDRSIAARRRCFQFLTKPRGPDGESFAATTLYEAGFELTSQASSKAGPATSTGRSVP